MAAVKEVIFRIRPKTKEAEKALKQLTKDSDLFAQSVEKSGKSVGFFGKQVKQISGIIAGAFAVDKIIRFTKEAFNLAKQAQGIEAAFARLNNPALLNDLRKATKGTVSDLSLMQKAVQARNFDIPLNQLAKLFQFANQRARETGESVDFLVNSIVLGIGRKSPLILDNLGISAVRLRKELKGVGSETASVGDIAAAVGSIIDQEMNPAVANFVSEADKIDQITANFENMQLQIGRNLIPVIASLAENFNNAIVGVVTLDARMELFLREITSAFGLFEKSAISSNAAIDAYNFGLTETGKRINELIPGFFSLNREQLVNLKLTQERIALLVEEGESEEDAVALVKALTEARLTEIDILKLQGVRTKQLTKATEGDNDAIEEKIRIIKSFEASQVFRDVENAQNRIDDLFNSLITDDLARQENAIEIKAEKEKRAVEKSLASDKQKAELLQLIDLNLQKERDALIAEASKKKTESDEEELKKEQERADKILEIRRKNANDVLELTVDSLGKALEANVKSIEFELEVQQGRVNRAVELAEQGNVAQLKAEEKRLVELQNKRRKAIDAEKALAAAEIAINTALTISDIIRGSALVLAQTGVAAPATIPIALAAFAGAAGIAGTLFSPPGFAEGTESVTGGGSEKSDSVPALLSRGERVVTAKKNKEYWNALSAIHNGTVPARELNDFVSNYSFERKPFTNTVVAVNHSKGTEDKLDEIADILKRQKGSTFKMDENGIYAVIDRIQMKNSRMSKYLS